MADSPSGKTIIILLLYMISVYTCSHVFMISAYDYDGFAVGGSHKDLLEAEEDINLQSEIITMQSEENLSGSDMFNKLNATYGVYQGKLLTWNWLDTGWYHVWKNSGDIETKIIDWKMDKLLDGNLTYDDLSFQESVGNALGAIWKGIGYVSGLLTFNIVGSTLSDGSEVPLVIMWIPMIMVIIPWIIIVIWLLPYLIKLVHAIADLVPL